MFSRIFCCFGFLVCFPCYLVHSQEWTKEQLVEAYLKSVQRIRSFDIVYAKGPASHWKEWDYLSKEQTRWRKSNERERVDKTDYSFSVFREENMAGTHAETKIAPMTSEYTDGEKLWRLVGNPQDANDLDLFSQNGMKGEIQSIASEDLQRGFPYWDFALSITLNNRTYSLLQLLTDAGTTVIAQNTNSHGHQITTRTLFQDIDDPNFFVQITFDSSVGYFPKRMIFPLDPIANKSKKTSYYIVKDFIEYTESGDRAFFPVKITSSMTDDISKVDNLLIRGKLAVKKISLNESTEVPAIEFPAGLIVVVESNKKLESFIWGESNKPAKQLTSDDYATVLNEYKKRQKNSPQLSPRPIAWWRIAFFVVGLLLIVVGLFLRFKKPKEQS